MMLLIQLIILALHGSVGSTLIKRQLYSNLTKDYDKRLLPVINSSDTVNISLGVTLVNIIDFEEMSGKLTFAAVFSINWTDQWLQWNPSKVEGVDSLVMQVEDIWVPIIFIQESFGKLQTIGSATALARVRSDGTVSWSTGGVVSVICPVDVTYFPFDHQSCPITLSSVTYGLSEVSFEGVGGVNTALFKPNSQWSLQGSSVETMNIFSSSIRLTMLLQRRPQFFIIYIAVPLNLLCLINLLVFAMPNGSGERMSVAITTFLAFVVNMNMINDIVPRSSSPIAYIYYYLMLMMAYSTVNMIFCAVSQIIYNKEGAVPQILIKAVVFARTCTKRRSLTGMRRNRVDTISLRNENETEEKQDNQDRVSTDPKTNVDVNEDGINGEVSWNDVGTLFDRACLVVVVLSFCPFSIVSIVQLYTNDELLVGIL